MTPPAHLLPLALEAMTSADACEVLGDALLECGWCTQENGSKVYNTMFGPYLVLSRPWRDVEGWFALGFERARKLSEIGNDFIRAIAAVLLFGEWSTTRWPLVEAHEARRRGRVTVTSIDRVGPTITCSDSGMTPTLAASVDILKPYWQLPTGKPKAPQRWWDGATTRRRGGR